MIEMSGEDKEERPSRNSRTSPTDALTSKGFALFEKLRRLRLEIAREEGMPPYIVFSDRTLIDMCVKMPRTRQEMLGVTGVGEMKYEKYGERFLQEISADI